MFTMTVILHHPDPYRRFYQQTDASDYATEGQLYQLDDDECIADVTFTSRTFKRSDLNYFSKEKDLLSIVHCLKKYRIHVWGRKLTIITDNKALTIRKCRLENSCITREFKDYIDYVYSRIWV